ncbi:hypothetical protein NQ318_008028 [Aromia moschata]|uniref:Uncharacterized protein n=1 Tax=Aromia moschata TaxID=1265417 RepID=A0AAV8XC90_9CUCU|nr:hypothetical protein NQ318_008028 [Aromia moschata]
MAEMGQLEAEAPAQRLRDKVQNEENFIAQYSIANGELHSSVSADFDNDISLEGCKNVIQPTSISEGRGPRKSLASPRSRVDRGRARAPCPTPLITAAAALDPSRCPPDWEPVFVPSPRRRILTRLCGFEAMGFVVLRDIANLKVFFEVMAEPRRAGKKLTLDSDSATPKTYSTHSKTPSATFELEGVGCSATIELRQRYEVRKLSNETGNVTPDLATLRRRDLEGRYVKDVTSAVTCIRRAAAHTG